MKKSILPLVLALLLGASTASANDSYGNYYYFVGTTAELLELRAAINHLFGEQSLAHGFSGLPAAAWTAPHDEEIDHRFMAGPFAPGGDLDCLPALRPAPDTAWNDGVGMYLGQSTTVDGVPYTMPAFEDLVYIADLPANCLAQICWWPTMQCEI